MFNMALGFNSFSPLDRAFALAAALGAVAFLARIVLQFVGGDLDGDDYEIHEGDAASGQEEGFKVLSMHGLSSFFLMFGLVGLALNRESQVGSAGAVLGACLAGAGMLWVLARLFRLFHRFQSSGTLAPGKATGCFGTVYLTIPAGGTGRVTIRIGQRQREMDALNEAGTELPTGTLIQVLRVDRAVAVVQPVSSQENPCPR